MTVSKNGPRPTYPSRRVCGPFLLLGTRPNKLQIDLHFLRSNGQPGLLVIQASRWTGWQTWTIYTCTTRGTKTGHYSDTMIPSSQAILRKEILSPGKQTFICACLLVLCSTIMLINYNCFCRCGFSSVWVHGCNRDTILTVRVLSC